MPVFCSIATIFSVSRPITITCPAVILAANRKLSVRGRSIILANSTIVKMVCHIGALSGRKCAIIFFIEDTIFLIAIIGLFSDGREWVFAEGPRDATVHGGWRVPDCQFC